MEAPMAMGSPSRVYRRTPRRQPIEVQRGARAGLIGPRRGGAEYRGAAGDQRRAIAIGGVQQPIGGGILEIRHPAANRRGEVGKSAEVVVHKHRPGDANAPREGLQQHDLLAFGHGSGLDFAILIERQQRREITHPQMAMRLEVAEIAAEKDLPIARLCRRIGREQHLIGRG
jgi:hypothetical protein